VLTRTALFYGCFLGALFRTRRHLDRLFSHCLRARRPTTFDKTPTARRVGRHPSTPRRARLASRGSRHVARRATAMRVRGETRRAGGAIRRCVDDDGIRAIDARDRLEARETREKRDGSTRDAAPERARDGRRENERRRETDGSTTGTRRCRTQNK
jgi:hypothetical protein